MTVRGTVRQRPQVTCTRIAPAGFVILATLQDAAVTLGLPLEITSGDEGTWRAPHDPHQTGEAYDVSVRGFSDPTIVQLYRYLGTTLGPAFTVLLEAPTSARSPSRFSPALFDHIYWNDRATGLHLHLQRKKGTTYPAPPGGLASDPGARG